MISELVTSTKHNQRRAAVSDPFADLEPKPLWRHFRALTEIPRPSGHEQRVTSMIKELAAAKGLAVREDTVGNLVVVVPAAVGCESSPPVALQGHVDMVCEKNRDVDHDFMTQGINVVRENEWQLAKGTTLGADNGVGVAAALALIDDPPARHGPLELLFTIDEERGLTGAAGIEPHMIESRFLLNLDSEEEGYVTVGCAGGGDTLFELACKREAIPAGWEPVQISVTGLRGGHSGIDILHNRANSLKCLGRALDTAQRAVGEIRLLAVEGGSKRNAIPREATAVVALPAGSRERAATACDQTQADLTAEFAATDPNLTVQLDSAPANAPELSFAADDGDRLIGLLLTVPSGVLAMNRGIAGLVETSSNLGVVETVGDTVRFVSCTRSAVGPALDGVRQALRALGERHGASVRLESSYPGWAPNLDSPLLGIFCQVHRDVVGKDPEVMAIHAGLECGLIGERFPGTDMVSFGPDMFGVHAPGERVSIPSTQRFFKLLRAVIEALATQEN